MIWDSNPWKSDIWRCSRYFKKLSLQPRRLSSSQSVSVEKRAFLAFYSIRKLIEAKKLSDECTTQNVRVIEYKKTKSIVTHLNWHHIDRHFDFEHSTVRDWSVLKLCHQFVHSYIFLSFSSEDFGLAGFFVASDRQKSSALLEIRTEQIISLFDSIAKDDVVASSYIIDPQTGKESFRLSNAAFSDDDFIDPTK